MLKKRKGYNEMLSAVSWKDSFRIKMDIETTSPNGDLCERVFTWHNPKGFVVEVKEHKDAD